MRVTRGSNFFGFWSFCIKLICLRGPLIKKFEDNIFVQNRLALQFKSKNILSLTTF